MKRQASSKRNTLDFPLKHTTAYMTRELLKLEMKLLRMRLAPWGISLGPWLYLRALWEKDGVTQRELGRSIGVNDASSRVALEGMERQKLVIRRRSRSDLRKIRVFLTPAGKQLKKDLLPVAKQVNDISLSDFSAAEADLFASFLRRARKSVEAAVNAVGAKKT